MHGLGQGNGAGPPIWGVVSTLVIYLLHDKGYGAFFKASISGTELSFVGYAFVNNTNLVTIPDKQATSHEIAKEMQDMVDSGKVVYKRWAAQFYQRSHTGT